MVPASGFEFPIRRGASWWRVAVRRLAGVSFAALTVAALGLAGRASAESLAEIRAGAESVAGEIRAQKSAGRFEAGAQQRAVDRLGKLVLAYIDASDRLSYAGAEGREREALRGTFEAIDDPLESVYDQNGARLERMAKQIMDEDGDLEALYETAAFKEAQVVASQALYYLNWLNYYGARLFEGARRKELFEKAQRGFSEFAVGERHTDLLVESLLGRGLCHLELGSYEFAVHDLRAVMDDTKASPERRSKARLALLDAYVRNGKVTDAVRLSDELLGGGSRAEDNVIRFLRARALLDAAKKGVGDPSRYRQEAMTTMEQLRRAGGGWSDKVAALLATSVDNPEQWAGKANSAFAKWEIAKLLVKKNDFKQAAPMLQDVIASNDGDVTPHKAEAQYFLGLAKFQAGDYQAAADNFAGALKAEKASYTADAAYLRFKALEALVAKNPSAALAAPYEQAIRDYLARAPEHKSAFEAQFRRGELLQAQRKFAEAVDAYAKVRGDNTFEMRAQFATLQCRFEQLQAMGKNTPEAERSVVTTSIGEGLQRFERQATDYEKSGGKGEQLPLTQMRAKAAVMRAVYATLQPPPNDQAVLDALAGFDSRYGDQTELLPQVVRLRLDAELHLGKFTDAATEVKAHGPVVLATLGPKETEDLAVAFIREGARRKGTEGAAVNQAAERVALELYQLLATDGEGPDKTKLTMARLYENTGDLNKAAAEYSAVLKSTPGSLPALRGLGRIAEQQQHLPEALGYWQQLTKTSRPGDAPWYEGQYEAARLTDVLGQRAESCSQLEKLKPSMPGLSDIELRKRFDALYKQVCA